MTTRRHRKKASIDISSGDIIGHSIAVSRYTPSPSVSWSRLAGAITMALF